MCSACAERDVPLGRDVCFASDVRFAREGAEHITSLCAQGAIHHYGEAITSLRQRRNITKKFPLALHAILWYNEKKEGGAFMNNYLMVEKLKKAGIRFDKGLTHTEISKIESQFGFHFPKEIASFCRVHTQLVVVFLTIGTPRKKT